jgi:hypothetical protein
MMSFGSPEWISPSTQKRSPCWSSIAAPIRSPDRCEVHPCPSQTLPYLQNGWS